MVTRGGRRNTVILRMSGMKFAGRESAAALVTALFAAIVFATISKHEPWADEAQSWLLARDNPLPDLLFRALRYEGSPGLWHLINWVASHAGLPYASINWIAGAFATGGIYLLMRLAPFPLLLRVLLPFTFFLSYQYAVIARNYVLAPALCFGIAWVIRERPEKYLLLAVLGGLLANVSSHGFLVAVCFLAAFAWIHRRKIDWRRAVPGVVLFAGFCLLAAWSARPAPDFGFVTVQAASLPRAGGGRVFHKLWRALEVLTLPFAGSVWAGLAALGLICWAGRRNLLYLLPVPVLLVFFATVYVAPWHTGMMFVAAVAGLWIVWPARMPKLVTAGLCLMALAQIPWTWHAVRADWREPYDGSLAAARYLREARGRIFGYGPYSAAVSAYFPGQIFANQASSYWVWSKGNRVDLEVARIGQEKPDLIVICGVEPQDPADALAGVERAAAAAGYAPVRAFRGRAPMRDGYREGNLYRVWARQGAAALY